jgi:crooked neck
VRGIYELGANQALLSTPELLWKSYIDFEVGEIDPDVETGNGDSEESGGRGRVRSLYERLVRQSGHWKVWIAWALFEGTEVRVGEEEEEEEEGGEDGEGGGVKIVPGNPVKAREIFKRGYDELKSRGEIEPVSSFCSGFDDVYVWYFSLTCSVWSCCEHGKSMSKHMAMRRT